MPTLTEANLNDPVTRHMRRDFCRIRLGQTVAQALDSVRQNPPEGRIVYFYATDDEGRLQGVLPTRRLLLNPPETPIEDILVRPAIAIPHSATVLDACEFFTLHRLLAFPVVDDEKRIIGLVDVDLYTEEMRDLEEREEKDDLFQLIGVHLTAAQQSNPVRAFTQRFPWLLTNVAGGIGAAFLSGIFQTELRKVVALALFIPVVLALAESVSIQSVSLALQTLHGQRPRWRTLLSRLGREAATGTMLGLACGLVVGSVALTWLGQGKVALCVLGGIAGGVSAAALIGVAIPNLLRMLRRDPQVAAGPVALASTDMVTLLLYFGLARWLLA